MSHGVEKLVDHQFRRWEFSRRSLVSEPPLPCVALSRPLGAGAAELGERVAELLSLPFFDREIVEWIAHRTGHREHLIAGVDAQIHSAIDHFITDGFTSQRFTEGDYLRHLVRIMAILGERGGAVVLGRGAQFILPPERTLRTLVVAPRPDRVERFRKRQSISAAEAEEMVRQADASRREFLMYHFHREPADPVDYDLCVNTSSLTLGSAARLVVAAYHERFPESQR